MRKTLTVPIVAALVLSGCHFSKVDSTATVNVSGAAFAADGTPLVDAQVRIFTEADLADLLFGSVLALGTLGSICLLPDAPKVCDKAHTATTGPDGTFSVKLKGSDTQGLVGTEATLDAVVAPKDATATTPTTTLSFTVKATTVQLPGARIWDAGARVSQTNSAIDLAWKPLPTSYGDSPSFSAQFYVPGQQAALWSQPGKDDAADIDPRLLEDQSSVAAAGADATLSGVGTGTVRAHYLSARLPVRATADAPQSRHRPCAAVMGTATITTAAQAACGATDGNLISPARLTGTNGAVVTGAVIDLGKAAPIRLVAAHGIAGMTVVEISSDGVHFREVGILTDSPAALEPPGAPVARYVRVRAPSGLDESLLYEISVWTR